MENYGNNIAAGVGRFAPQNPMQTVLDEKYAADRMCAPTANETITSINEESISGMQNLCNALNEIANRTGGAIPSAGNAALEKSSQEPSIKDRARMLRGLVYTANELTQRIFQNLI